MSSALNRWGVWICAKCRNGEHHGVGGWLDHCQCICTGYYDSKGRDIAGVEG